MSPFRSFNDNLFDTKCPGMGKNKTKKKKQIVARFFFTGGLVALQSRLTNKKGTSHSKFQSNEPFSKFLR
jgi:hypothetical protein